RGRTCRSQISPARKRLATLHEAWRTLSFVKSYGLSTVNPAVMSHTDWGTKIAYSMQYCPLRLMTAWERVQTQLRSRSIEPDSEDRRGAPSMGMRSQTTWVYTISLLCVLTPNGSFGQSLGDAAAAEGKRRAARQTSTSSDKDAQGTTSNGSSSK